MNPWIAAARPKTLVAGFIPVLVGSAWAYQRQGFQLWIFVAALLGCIAIQIGTNYVNDASDFEKGADTEERLGPPRMAASGKLTPRALYLAAGFSFFIAFLFGLYLIFNVGLPILAIGVFSIFFAIIYTAGPFPLAYLGLGDLFVLIFFGFVAVLGTVYSHLHIIDLESFFISLAIGLQGVSLIAVNNLRDIPTDRKVGKKTFSVRIGDRASRYYYSFLLFIPYIFWFPVAQSIHSWIAYLPILSLPLAIANTRNCFAIKDRKQFNALLGKTAALQCAFGILAALSMVIT